MKPMFLPEVEGESFPRIPSKAVEFVFRAEVVRGLHVPVDNPSTTMASSSLDVAQDDPEPVEGSSSDAIGIVTKADVWHRSRSTKDWRVGGARHDISFASIFLSGMPHCSPSCVSAPTSKCEWSI